MPRFFLWFYIFFVLQLPTLSDFANEFFIFTISDAGHWLASSDTRALWKISFKPAIERARRLSKNICGVLCISSGLNSAGASNLKNVHLKFIAAKVNVSSTVESRNVHRVTRTSELNRRHVDIHDSLSCTNYYRSWWVGFRGRGAGAWSVQHIALFLTCI